MVLIQISVDVAAEGTLLVKTPEVAKHIIDPQIFIGEIKGISRKVENMKWTHYMQFKISSKHWQGGWTS